MKKIRISRRRIFQSHEGREKRKFFFWPGNNSFKKERTERERVCALKRVTFFLSSLKTSSFEKETMRFSASLARQSRYYIK